MLQYVPCGTLLMERTYELKKFWPIWSVSLMRNAATRETYASFVEAICRVALVISSRCLAGSRALGRIIWTRVVFHPDVGIVSGSVKRSIDCAAKLSRACKVGVRWRWRKLVISWQPLGRKDDTSTDRTHHWSLQSLRESHGDIGLCWSQYFWSHMIPRGCICSW